MSEIIEYINPGPIGVIVCWFAVVMLVFGFIVDVVTDHG